jgi:broad specificity phosphatase PhoE
LNNKIIYIGKNKLFNKYNEMRIYIRHADKAYENGKSEHVQHDPGITPHGRLRTGVLTEELIGKYGLPTLIVCSPYLRARQTAYAMSQWINKNYPGIGGGDIPIYCDVGLSEYLGNHRKVSLDVMPSTSYFKPPHPENFYLFRKRVKQHNDRVRNSPLQHTVVWFITHGVLVREIGRIHHVKVRKYVPNLSYLTVNAGDDAKIKYS